MKAVMAAAAALRLPMQRQRPHVWTMRGSSLLGWRRRKRMRFEETRTRCEVMRYPGLEEAACNANVYFGPPLQAQILTTLTDKNRSRLGDLIERKLCIMSITLGNLIVSIMVYFTVLTKQFSVDVHGVTLFRMCFHSVNAAFRQIDVNKYSRI